LKSGDIRIRQAKPKDFAKVAEMHFPVWRKSWDGMLADYMIDLIATPTLWATRTYPETLSRSGWAMWIAESGSGKTLGMTIFGPDGTNPGDVLIDALYTAPESQGLGVAGRLLNKASHAQPSGDVVLWCAEKNLKGREYYEKKGFQLDGRTLVWKPLPGVTVPHVGYRLKRQ
jgi:GNAT superfamily N-acetyltransferase